jgi:hypothetical protein
MNIYLEKKDVVKYYKGKQDELSLKGYTEYEINSILAAQYTNSTNIKYSKEEQDRLLEYWFHIILEVDGGYWQFIELMQQPHSEFCHYNFKNMASYERNNVPKTIAERELDEKAYNRYMERFINKKLTK